MNTLPTPRRARGRWLIALSALLVAPGCGREDDPAAPTGGAAGVDFSKLSTQDPSQVDGALRALGIDPPVEEPHSLQRGAAVLPAHLLWPLGEVRREGLASYRLDLDLAAFATAGSDSATLRFRDGSTVLFQEVLTADAWTVARPLPPAVLEAATKGNVITWGLTLSDRRSKPIEGTFKVIEKAQATRKLTEFENDKRLTRVPVFLSLAKAQVLENYTLLAEALPLYVELSRDADLWKSGVAGVARCLQRLGSHHKHLALRESFLYRNALELMVPQKGSGGTPTPGGSGPSALGPPGAGGGPMDTPGATASAGGPKTAPSPGGTAPGSGGPTTSNPGATPGTPPAEEPPATADEPLVNRAVQVVADHAERLKERAASDGHGLTKAREHADHALQQALASQQAADAAEKRFEDERALRGQQVPGTEPTDKEKLKLLKDAADAARQQAEADEAKAKAAQDMVRAASAKEGASSAAARRQEDEVRRLRHGLPATPPEGLPSVPAPGSIPPGKVTPGGMPPEGKPNTPAGGMPPTTLDAPQLQELLAAVAESQTSADIAVKEANHALEAAIAARKADPSAANAQAMKDAQAQLEKAQKALDQANAVAARLRREADAAGTPPR